MTTSTTPATQGPSVPLGLASRFGRIGLAVLGLVVVVAGTYAYAWWRADSLSTTYLADADESYEQGNYLEALVGFQQFDQQTNQYVQRGGYMQVEKIWASTYARPEPPGATRAKERVDEIIRERLRIEEAEQFVQANIGRSTPYMGPIYLRLGELYEAEGDERSAREIYESIPSLFAAQPELIDRAQAHLARLGEEE